MVRHQHDPLFTCRIGLGPLPPRLLELHRGVAHVARGLPVADLGEHAGRVRLLRDRAAAVPAHHPELGRVDVVQERL